IVNCHSAVDVICWGGHTGGVVGYVLNGGVVENCGSSGTVEAQNDDAGGIAGILKSNSGIKNSYSTGKVIAPVNRVGGIAGALDLDCFVENCYSTGEIAGADYIGGIVGKLISSTVRDSYSTGAVYGLAGDVYIDGKTMSTGGAVDSGLGGQTVYVVLGDYVGGVAGELKNGKVVNCYSAGPVWGHKEVGGVVGTLSVGSIVQNSVAFNPSVRASLKDAGRVVGVFYNGATANSHAYSSMTNSEGAPFTGEAGADVTAVEAKSAVFWTAVFGSGEASAWTYDEGYLPLLKGVGGQTRKVPGEFDDEEVIDAKTGATSKHEGGGSGDGGNASGNENTGGGSGDSADTGSGGAGNNANTGDSNNGGGSSANAGGSSAAVPADQAAGVATMADSGPIILADGGTVITVPKNTAINRNTGVITVTDGGDVTLADGRTVIAVPPATTIDPERATMTVVSQGGGIVTLPVGQVGEIEGGVKVHVPDGSEIDLKTGVITLPDGGRIIFQSTDGAERSGSLSGDRAFTVTAGTTVSPATGVITVTNGGDVTLPDGSTLTAAPGTTIDPFTGRISQPDGTELEYEGGSEAGASSGGCDAGMAGFALIALALGAAAIRKTR
ncbi:MAG: hypothetical protein LBL73_06525, partial [Synergistaceae bacterium]|nr:hypothetical protein [Synergistaceae bacterium]